MIHRRILFVLAGLFTFTLFEATNTLFPHSLSSSLNSALSSDATYHPIPSLMAEAESNYRRLITRQSDSLTAAVAEYRRRYKRDPPKGFDDWFAFAKENDVKIIDEYDAMVKDFAPFWDLSGEEIRRRALQVSYLLWTSPKRLIAYVYRLDSCRPSTL